VLQRPAGHTSEQLTNSRTAYTQNMQRSLCNRRIKLRASQVTTAIPSAVKWTLLRMTTQNGMTRNTRLHNCHDGELTRCWISSPCRASEDAATRHTSDVTAVSRPTECDYVSSATHAPPSQQQPHLHKQRHSHPSHAALPQVALTPCNKCLLGDIATHGHTSVTINPHAMLICVPHPSRQTIKARVVILWGRAGAGKAAGSSQQPHRYSESTPRRVRDS
jgi:hypothetical protein